MKSIFTSVLVAALLPSVCIAAAANSPKIINIERTVQIDKILVGVTRDLKTIAFNCDTSWFGSKGSLAIIENSAHEITVKESSHDGVRMGIVSQNLSQKFKLSKTAEAAICSAASNEAISLKVDNETLDINQ